MKVLVATGDMLLEQLLHSLLSTAEGVSLRFAPAVFESPDGAADWVCVVSSEDDQALPEQLIGQPWVAGLVIIRTGRSRPQRTTAQGPYGELPGIIELALPVPTSKLLEALLSARSAATTAREGTADNGKRSYHLLVAEDSQLQRSLVVSTLKAEGFIVSEAEDGRQALSFLRSHPVDLLLTDVEMPHMTGLELTREVRADGRLVRLPVLMLTTLSGFEQIKEGFEAGASDYLVKPRKGEREGFMEEMVGRVWQLLAGSRPGQSRRALVVDDSKLTRQMVAGALSRAGFQVTTAEDGAQAWELLSTASQPLPDIVVTDLEMPVTDGLRLTHSIKQGNRTRELPVVILSASTEHEHRVLGRGFGVDAFISKPFSEEKLLVTVEQVLLKNRLEREKRELSKIMGRDVLKAIHGEGLAPRTREVTVLFSDLAGFSKMCDGMDAPGVVTLLNDYFDRFVDFVLREQGYINKFIGDALMALFSDLPGLDAPQVRAVRAALTFQREMATLNRTAPTPLLTRIGINNGEVVMGLIGGGERKDYTVIGDAVNRAQRLESKSPVGGVLLSAECYGAVTSWLTGQEGVTVTAVDGLQLKGISHPVTAYALTVGEPQ